MTQEYTNARCNLGIKKPVRTIAILLCLLRQQCRADNQIFCFYVHDVCQTIALSDPIYKVDSNVKRKINNNNLKISCKKTSTKQTTQACTIAVDLRDLKKKTSIRNVTCADSSSQNANSPPGKRLWFYTTSK